MAMAKMLVVASKISSPKTNPLKRNPRISAVAVTRTSVTANIVAPVFRKTLPENRRLPEFFFVATQRLISQGARILRGATFSDRSESGWVTDSQKGRD